MTTHGESNTRLFNIWGHIKQRCNNPNNHDYPNYGLKGIKICTEWKNSYIKFRNWALENDYNDLLTIDRMDISGDYEPSNCRWITVAEQNRNKSDTHFLTFNNETHCIDEWTRIKNFNRSTIRGRLKSGWSIEKILTTPIKNRKRRTK